MLPRKYTQVLLSKLLKLKSTATLDVESGASIRVVSPQTGAVSNTLSTAELAVLDGITATTAEINRAADTSARIVDCTAATLTLAEATHDNKVVTFNRAAGCTVTLPASTGL